MIKSKAGMFAILGAALAGAMQPLMSININSGVRGDRHAPKTKPKQGRSNPLRGYYARYSNVLTPMAPEINMKNATNKNKLKRERRAGKC